MSIHIRPARPDDADTIALFNSLLASETEGKTLDPAVLRPGVAAMLADPNKGRYLVAEDVGSPGLLGQLGITLEWSDWRNGWFWWIQSVYVRAEARRRGVFRALYRHVEELARAAGDVIGVRLYVESDNHAAHAVYESLGLAWTGYRLMEKSPLQR